MKPIAQKKLAGIAECVAMTLIFSVGLSVAVNYNVAQFEQKAQNFLPTAQPESNSQDP
jgi:hypothetical protein